MKIEVHYSHSVKDASGSLHHYRTMIEDEIDVAGLTAEQKVSKSRQVHAFWHNEIHKMIVAQQAADGIPESLRGVHNNVQAVVVRAKAEGANGEGATS